MSLSLSVERFLPINFEFLFINKTWRRIFIFHFIVLKNPEFIRIIQIEDGIVAKFILPFIDVLLRFLSFFIGLNHQISSFLLEFINFKFNLSMPLDWFVWIKHVIILRHKLLNCVQILDFGPLGDEVILFLVLSNHYCNELFFILIKMELRFCSLLRIVGIYFSKIELLWIFLLSKIFLWFLGFDIDVSNDIRKRVELSWFIDYFWFID